MFAHALTAFWTPTEKSRTVTAPPRKRPAPIFIGDAVQPWAGETLLLAILRDETPEDTGET